MSSAGAPLESPVVSPRTRDQTDSGWEVLVWNDPVNTMSYVVYVLMKVLRFDRNRATRHMLEVHQKGQSCVALEVREKAELYHQQILSHGLRCTLRRAG